MDRRGFLGLVLHFQGLTVALKSFTRATWHNERNAMDCVKKEKRERYILEEHILQRYTGILISQLG